MLGVNMKVRVGRAIILLEARSPLSLRVAYIRLCVFSSELVHYFPVGKMNLAW